MLGGHPRSMKIRRVTDDGHVIFWLMSIPGGCPCLRQGFGRQARTMKIQELTDTDHGHEHVYF
jgi:hypothetical protein